MKKDTLQKTFYDVKEAIDRNNAVAATRTLRTICEDLAKYIVRENGYWEAAKKDRDGSVKKTPLFSDCLYQIQTHDLMDRKDYMLFDHVRELGNQATHESIASLKLTESYFAEIQEYIETVFAKQYPDFYKTEFLSTPQNPTQEKATVDIGISETQSRPSAPKSQYQDRLQQTNKSDEEREKDEQARKREEEERKRKAEEEKRKSAPEAAMEKAWLAYKNERWESAEHLFAQVLKTEGIDNEPSIQKVAAFMLMRYQRETERSAAAREELKTICSDSPWICLALACTSEGKEAKEWADYGMQVPGPPVPRQYCEDRKSMIDHREKEQEAKQQREAEQKRREEERQRALAAEEERQRKAAAEEEERKAEQARIA